MGLSPMRNQEGKEKHPPRSVRIGSYRPDAGKKGRGGPGKDTNKERKKSVSDKERV